MGGGGEGGGVYHPHVTHKWSDLYDRDLLIKILKNKIKVTSIFIRTRQNDLLVWSLRSVCACVTSELWLCTAQVSRFSRISRMRTSYSYITPLRRYLSWYLGGAGAYNTIFKIALRFSDVAILHYVVALWEIVCI